MDINAGDLLLCEFYFSDFKQTKKRPVLVFKNNLPFNDFFGIPVSSQLQQLHEDELLIEQSDFIQGDLPKKSKIMIRKTFVISKQVVIKKYGSLSPQRFEHCHQAFCRYLGCY